MANKRIYLIANGQSNEAGASPNTVTGVYAAFRAQSYIVRVIEKIMARRANTIAVGSTAAVGSTSVANNFTGYCRTWVSGMNVCNGSYVLSDGAIWKCNIAAASVLSSTSAPTGTANITTALPDGGLWTYLGAPGAKDVDGAIYNFGDARFDPNGYLNSASYGSMPNTGLYDAKIVIAAWCQQDAAMRTSRAAYAAALASMVETWRAKGATKVLLGMSFWDPANFNHTGTVLVPALGDVLATYANDPFVSKGVDLYTMFGNFGTTVAVPGKPAGATHPNDPAYELAAEAYYSRLLELGLI